MCTLDTIVTMIMFSNSCLAIHEVSSSLLFLSSRTRRYTQVTTIVGKASEGVFGGYGGDRQCGTAVQTGQFREDDLYQIMDVLE